MKNKNNNGKIKQVNEQTMCVNSKYNNSTGASKVSKWTDMDNNKIQRSTRCARETTPKTVKKQKPNVLCFEARQLQKTESQYKNNNNMIKSRTMSIKQQTKKQMKLNGGKKKWWKKSIPIGVWTYTHTYASVYLFAQNNEKVIKRL